MKENNEIGQRLKEIRVFLGLTLERMSRETGVSVSYISDFERDKRLPSVKYLSRLLEYFNVSIDYIFTGTGEMLLTQRERSNDLFDFGPYQKDIDELLSIMGRVPNAMFAVLQFFAEYKIEKEDFIAKVLKKMAEGEKRADFV